MLLKTIFCLNLILFLIKGVSVYCQDWKSCSPIVNSEVSQVILGDNVVDTGNETTGSRICRIMSSEAGILLINKVTGILQSVLYTLPKRDAVVSDINIDQARNTVIDWMQSIKFNIKDWTLFWEKKRNLGSAGDEYAFFWTRFTKEGVRLPCYVSATVRSDGYLESCGCIDDPVNICTKPSIASSVIIERISKTTTPLQDKNIQCMLRVWTLEGKQRLLWELYDGTDYSRSPLVTVDANSGEIIKGKSQGNKKRSISIPPENAKELAKMLNDIEAVEVKSGQPMICRKLPKGSPAGRKLASFVARILASDHKTDNNAQYKDLLRNGAFFHIKGGDIIIFAFSHRFGTVRISLLQKNAPYHVAIPYLILNPAPKSLKSEIINALKEAVKVTPN